MFHFHKFEIVNVIEKNLLRKAYHTGVLISKHNFKQYPLNHSFDKNAIQKKILK